MNTRFECRRFIGFWGICALVMGPHNAASEVEPTLPGRPCECEPLEEWTDQEDWVWKMVCEGKIADFNEDTLPDIGIAAEDVYVVLSAP